MISLELRPVLNLTLNLVPFTHNKVLKKLSRYSWQDNEKLR